MPLDGPPGIGDHLPAVSHRGHHRTYHHPAVTRMAVIRIRRAPVGVITAKDAVIGTMGRRIPDRKIVWIKIGAVIGKSLWWIRAKRPGVVACTIVRSFGGPLRDIVVSCIVNIHRVVRAGTAHQQGQQKNLEQCFHTANKNTMRRVNQR